MTSRGPGALVALLGIAGMASAQPGDENVDVAGLRELRDARVEVQDFAAALEPAETVVAELEGQGAKGIAGDVLMLGRIHAGLRDFEAAELDYLKAIEMISDEDGEFTPALVDIHQALGRVYINARRFPEAIAVLEQGQAISRRNEGLFNVDQSGLIDDLTLAQLGTGNTIAARDLQVERLENAQRRFGDDDSRLIPFHTHLGDYYDSSRLRVSAREQYSRALELSEVHYGTQSNQAVALLRRLTEIDLMLDDETPARERLEAVLASDAEISPIERGLSLATLGDWAIVNELTELATTNYDEAYRLLDQSPGVDAVQFFATPKMLNFVPPLSSVDRGARSLPWTWGDLELEFEVSADGRVRNVDAVSMEPRIRDLRNDFVRRMREAYFRPRLIDGRPVTTEDVRYRQSFRYYVEDD
jgi:tetratricopeptide (TPR) repeat protein